MASVAIAATMVNIGICTYSGCRICRVAYEVHTAWDKVSLLLRASAEHHSMSKGRAARGYGFCCLGAAGQRLAHVCGGTDSPTGHAGVRSSCGDCPRRIYGAEALVSSRRAERGNMPRRGRSAVVLAPRRAHRRSARLRGDAGRATVASPRWPAARLTAHRHLAHPRFEVQAQIAADRGEPSDAIAFLERELATYLVQADPEEHQPATLEGVRRAPHESVERLALSSGSRCDSRREKSSSSSSGRTGVRTARTSRPFSQLLRESIRRTA